MEELRKNLSDFLTDRLYQITISSPRKEGDAFKIKVRPVMVKGDLYFQETIWKGTQVFHGNYEKEEILERILSGMELQFRQLEAESTEEKLWALVSKKGKVTIKRRRNRPEQGKLCPDLSHNRKKQYILKENEAVPFLVDLGVQTGEGKIEDSRSCGFLGQKE